MALTGTFLALGADKTPLGTIPYSEGRLDWPDAGSAPVRPFDQGYVFQSDGWTHYVFVVEKGDPLPPYDPTLEVLKVTVTNYAFTESLRLTAEPGTGLTLGDYADGFSDAELRAIGASIDGVLFQEVPGIVEEGTTGIDSMMGTAGADNLSGLAGADLIKGRKGDDFLFGGADNDTVYGQKGADEIYGGAGDDRLGGGREDDLVEGGDGEDRIYGSFGDDILKGNEKADRLFGARNEDALYGGKGDDFLSDGGGDDLVFGGTGNDEIVAGGGNDQFTGGQGADTFVFRVDGQASGTDEITDYAAAEDRLIFQLTGGGSLPAAGSSLTGPEARALLDGLDTPIVTYTGTSATFGNPGDKLILEVDFDGAWTIDDFLASVELNFV